MKWTVSSKSNSLEIRSLIAWLSRHLLGGNLTSMAKLYAHTKQRLSCTYVNIYIYVIVPLNNPTFSIKMHTSRTHIFKSWSSHEIFKKDITVSAWKWRGTPLKSPVTRCDALLDPKTATKADKAAKTTRMTRMPTILKQRTRWWLQSIW